MSRIRIRGVVAGAVALAALGCDRRSPPDPSQAAPSASVITIANAFGTCDDLAVCESECDAGSSDRCRRLGVNYEFGQRVAKDEARAVALYERACGMGNSSACVAAGRMYEFHHGVAKDDGKAAGFYSRACDIGDAVGCANFAILLEGGRGVAKDEARAERLFDDACTRGAGLACDHAKELRARMDATGPR